jgi:hypothetical protein
MPVRSGLGEDKCENDESAQGVEIWKREKGRGKARFSNRIDIDSTLGKNALLLKNKNDKESE